MPKLEHTAKAAKKSSSRTRQTKTAEPKKTSAKTKPNIVKPIGVIRTPFPEPKGTPIGPSRSYGARGMVWIERQYRDALQDLKGFDRVWLIYWLHKAPKGRPLVKPFLDEQPRGLFATRAPFRFNPIGISAVRVLEVYGDRLDVADIDVVDGAPLLDIKPYIPEFDSFPGSKAGWCDDNQNPARVDDGLFMKAAQDSTESVCLAIEGMKSPKCVARIQTMLKDLAGVLAYEVEIGSVNVTFDVRRQGPGRIIRAIKTLGYGAKNAKKPLGA
jgi:tRNA-Thr(GGU) m(6)t(6)A37 methyltransferase TsaA